MIESAESPIRRSWRRLRAEPVVHFFLLGLLLFAVQRWLVGEPRTISVTVGLEAELARRFEDLHGRTPDAVELQAELQQWQRDEALFREALRRRLDRDDPGIRSLLVGKLKAEALAEVPERTPSDAELQRWLESHRERYELPLRYEFEFFRFTKSLANAASERERFAQALRDGTSPTSLGHPLLGAHLSLAEMQGRVPSELIQSLPRLPPGQWQGVDAEQELLLARVKRVDGGLPSLDVLRPRLVPDWSLSTRQEAADRTLQATIDRYRVEPSE